MSIKSQERQVAARGGETIGYKDLSNSERASLPHKTGTVLFMHSSNKEPSRRDRHRASVIPNRRPNAI